MNILKYNPVYGQITEEPSSVISQQAAVLELFDVRLIFGE
jgi:hypothetical protein